MIELSIPDSMVLWTVFQEKQESCNVLLKFVSQQGATDIVLNILFENAF
jgi:hypothetical protein